LSRSATTTAKAKGAPPRARWTLSPEKGKELLAVLLSTIGLLLALSLVSFHPDDPSLLYHTAFAVQPKNWIGPLGAQLAAILFSFFGLACLLLPLLVLVAGLRRFLTTESDPVPGRGFGTLLVLVSLPGLLQLVLGAIAWRGVPIAAGGGFGKVAVDLLASHLSFVGSLLILSALVVTGGTLMVQSTLGEVASSLWARFGSVVERCRLAYARWRERRVKDEARRRVVTKHLKRAEERREALRETLEEPTPAMEPAEPPPPVRVVERTGGPGVGIRRVSRPRDEGEELALGTPERGKTGRGAASPSTAAAPKAQAALPFEDDLGGGPLPPTNLLQMDSEGAQIDENELIRQGELIRSRCAEFGVEGTIAGIGPGPVITVFEFQPAPGVKVSQIVNLQDDLALALKAESVRIDRMPGRSTLGIEVPNPKRSIIRLGRLIADERFTKAASPLTIALGTTISGKPYYADLATMPHLLVAGATGAGKSVGLQSMITSIIYKASKDDVKFIFIDPKRIELGVYADIPHLKAEVVVDPKKAANALAWAVGEMERRYRLLAEVHVRSIAYYNQAIRDPEVRKRLSLSDDDGVQQEDLKQLPYYVIIIDELADLMMVASSEVETCIARLAQMARAVGIHLIIATQRPSVDVLTGTIKANFPCRIAYATATRHDSRTILDQVGSEKLLGKGDALFMPPGTSRITRLHGAYITEQETASLVRWLKKRGKPELDPEVLADAPRSGGSGGHGDEDEDDPLFDEVARLVVAEGQASASFLQRRMRIGFARAGRLIDMMERDGLLGPPQGSKAREVLVPPGYFEEIDRARAEG
jgi:DNA segregation ATPase FtsK/SpoIIIE, S-DNA-T family